MIIVKKATKLWAIFITFLVVGTLSFIILHLWHNFQKYIRGIKIFETRVNNRLGSPTGVDVQKGNITHMNILVS